MSASALFLSRLQFVWVIGRHIILPAFTAGAGAVDRTHRCARRQAARLKICTKATIKQAVNDHYGPIRRTTRPVLAGRSPSIDLERS
jgi:hypothetical protein